MTTPQTSSQIAASAAQQTPCPAQDGHRKRSRAERKADHRRQWAEHAATCGIIPITTYQEPHWSYVPIRHVAP